MSESIVNMSDPHKRSALLNALQKLRGRYRIGVTKYRPRRSDRQNRYYWPCFVHPFGDWMREQGNDVTDEQAHDILKHRFLRVDRLVGVNRAVTIEYTRSTTSLDTSEFNEYLDNCANWLSEFCNIIVPEPNEYHELPMPAPRRSTLRNQASNEPEYDDSPPF